MLAILENQGCLKSCLMSDENVEVNVGKDRRIEVGTLAGGDLRAASYHNGRNRHSIFF
jgi:hypothetical protein